MLSPNTLRIGYVVKRYPRYSETFIVNEILAHEAAGCEIEIFSLRAPIDTHFQDRIARVKAPVNYLPSESIKAAAFWRTLEISAQLWPGFWAKLEGAQGEGVQNIYQALTLARAAWLSGITHLHAHFASSAAAVARLAANFAGLTYSFTAHAKDIYHESAQQEDLQRKLADAAAVVTVSDYNLSFLRETFGSAAGRVQRVYNGLDLNDFPYAAPQSRPPQIVAVGRLIEKKGFADLIEACALLARDGHRFECQIVGTGELEAELRAKIEHLSLQATVQLRGPRPQAEVVKIVQSAAVFAAPCVIGSDGNRDGLPTVLLEAMALGTPCVSSDVTGIPEVLRNEQTGLMTPQHDPPALAAALARLLTDSALRCRLAAAARRLVESEFDIHQNAARIREIFRAAQEKPPIADAAPLQEALG